MCPSTHSHLKLRLCAASPLTFALRPPWQCISNSREAKWRTVSEEREFVIPLEVFGGYGHDEFSAFQYETGRSMLMK